MPEFFYTGQNSQGKEVWGNVRAATLEEASLIVEARGFVKVKVRVSASSEPTAKGWWARWQECLAWPSLRAAPRP